MAGFVCLRVLFPGEFQPMIFPMTMPANYFMALDEKTWSYSFGEEQCRNRLPVARKNPEN